MSAWLSRFDHAVVAVRDLDRAMAAFVAAGFEVRPGGVHTSLGTHNAIVRFGLDYIELLAAYDEKAARANVARSAMLDFLRDHEGLIGYAAATADIEGLAERFATSGLDAVGPFAMSRRRPDGRELSWRLLIPEGLAWRRPWPFIIQWDASDRDRLAWERPGTHPNGAAGIRGVRVLVRALHAGRSLYAGKLGLRERAIGVFDVGSTTVELLSAGADARLSSVLASEGEGLYELVLATADLARSRRALERSGLEVREDRSGLHVGGPETAGARFAFVDAAY